MTGEHVVIVGSGPAAVGVALALTSAGVRDVDVIDLGGTLEPETADLVAGLAGTPVESWDADATAAISRSPVVATKGELPQKRVFGSDFPFRDNGQLAGLTFRGGANSSPISSAYGGFSNVWGAQIMPFSRATFDTWPVSWDQIAPHYEAVLGEVPLAGEADDLLELFPLLSERATPLPPLVARSQRVLDNYAKHRGRVNDHGVLIGRARLALNAPACVRCNLCMTGCPHGLIYSASQTFDRLRREGLVSYRSGRLVTSVGEDDEGCFVRTRSLTDGTHDTVRADRVFVACGGIGSTRLVLGSVPQRPSSLTMSESVQFAVPFVSATSTGDPRPEPGFTLNQFNLLVDFDGRGYHTSQVHCYPYNPSVMSALPAPLQLPQLSAVAGKLLGRLTIGLGYLPSWASPPVRLTVGPQAPDGLPSLTIGTDQPDSQPLMLKEVMRRLRRVGRPLDLHPVEAALRVSASAKSYHFGGSFPHRRNLVDGQPGTDVWGRPAGWQRVHMVDGAVLPSVPSTTFTLTVMANAHRIASAVAAGQAR